MTETKARQVVLAARPQGKPRLTDFRLEETAIPTPGPGQVLLQIQYLVVDVVGECRHVVGSAGNRLSDCLGRRGAERRSRVEVMSDGMLQVRFGLVDTLD